MIGTIKAISEPRGIAAGEGGVWVGSYAVHNTLVRIDPTSNQVVATIKGDGFGFLEGVATYRGGVWVASTGGWVLKIDPKTNRIVAKIKVGGYPRHIAAGEGALWVVDQTNNEVFKIDPVKNSLVANIPLDPSLKGGWHRDICVGGGSVWVTFMTTARMQKICQIDAATNKLVKTYEIDEVGLYGATVGGGFLWVSGYECIYQINLTNGEIVETIGKGRVGTSPKLLFAQGNLWAPVGDRVIRIGKLRVEMAEAERPKAGEIVINQIDISNFPNVVLYVTVFDAEGNLVTGLQEGDFKVLEDEAEQSPISLATQLPALATVVAVDTSGSMRRAMPEVQRAAISFINNMRGQDLVLLSQFAETVKVMQSFTTDKDALQKAIRAMTARGNTALYDAVYQAVDSFGEKRGRKVIVLLTDGKDDDGFNRQLSRRSLKEAIAAASELNVPIYTIGLGTEVDTEVLRRLAEETGGRYFPSPTAAELEGLYRQIIAQLEGQYRISYKTNITELDGSWHRVVVKARGSMGEKKYKAPTQSPQGR